MLRPLPRALWTPIRSDPGDRPELADAGQVEDPCAADGGQLRVLTRSMRFYTLSIRCQNCLKVPLPKPFATVRSNHSLTKMYWLKDNGFIKTKPPNTDREFYGGIV